VLYARDRLAEALAEVRLARPREPDAEVELWTGKILERLGKPQEAAAAFRKARQLDPSLHEAAFLHGRALLAQGLAREAITELTTVTAATDAYPAAFVALGLALRERDQKEEALTHFLRAALLDPTSGEAAYWAGRTRVELGRPADALYHLRRAVLAQNPGPWHADAHLWLARALVKQNQRDEATSMYTTYLRLAGPRAAARAEAEKLSRGH
jgi:tetratricopeptide (TPR) repeat protein